jgi:hypothetical protein
VLRAGAGAALAGLAGCDLLGGEPAPAPSPDPLAPLLAGTVELISRYDAALAAHPELSSRLMPVRETHVAHAAELARVTGVATPATTGPMSGGSSSSPADPADARGTLAALRAAEQVGRRAAGDACLAAPAERATLLGSIAAARASHAEALR